MAAQGGHALTLRQRLRALPPTAQALLWTASAGVCFAALNAGTRLLAQQVNALETQFLRYVFGLVVLLPLVWRDGAAAFRPHSIGGQFARGVAHTLGLCLWFLALPHITLADTTAIGFTTPIFIMLGARLFLGEAMRWERWAATVAGFAGVLIVVGPKFSASGGVWHLVMLASAPVFAASFLITKALTRYESTNVILLWQALTVSVLSFPLALAVWEWPTAWQWFGFFLCGLLGSAGHWCLTHAIGMVDLSATQSVKFLDLVWSTLVGWLLFGDLPSQSTLLGGVVICAATIWVARREAHAGARSRAAAGRPPQDAATP